MPDSQSHPPGSELLDLRGVRCPLNWARARVRLDQMAAGTSLVLIVDDPRAVRDIPLAAEATGYLVAEVNEQSDGSWQIEIHK